MKFIPTDAFIEKIKTTIFETDQSTFNSKVIFSTIMLGDKKDDCMVITSFKSCFKDHPEYFTKVNDANDELKKVIDDITKSEEA